MIHLGGDKDVLRRVHGDIVASYRYVNGERALCLWPRYRKGAVAFIVCDSSAWKYNPDYRTEYDEEGKPTSGAGYLLYNAMWLAQQWGDGVSRQRATQIADIIVEGLADLVKIPPPPEQRDPTGPCIGEGEIRLDGKTIASVPILDTPFSETSH